MPKTPGSFRKGDNRPRKPKGSQNRTTKEAKELLNIILFDELDNIKDSLKKIRDDNDYRYIDCLSKLFTYVLPKKTDVTSGDEKIVTQLPIIQIKTNGD